MFRLPLHCHVRSSTFKYFETDDRQPSDIDSSSSFTLCWCVLIRSRDKSEAYYYYDRFDYMYVINYERHTLYTRMNSKMFEINSENYEG